MKKYKIIADKEQLENIGIDYDITGLIGEKLYVFPTGWYEIEVQHKVGNHEFTNRFDLPKTFLEEVK